MWSCQRGLTPENLTVQRKLDLETFQQTWAEFRLWPQIWILMSLRFSCKQLKKLWKQGCQVPPSTYTCPHSTSYRLNFLWGSTTEFPGITPQKNLTPKLFSCPLKHVYFSLPKKDGAWTLLLLPEREVCNKTCLLGCTNSILRRKNILF